MKKFLSLVTLLLCAVVSVSAQTTLLHWAYDKTSSVQTITNGTALTGVTGGTVTPGTTNDSKAFSAKDKISGYGNNISDDMKAAGTAGSNAYYLKNGSGALSLAVVLTSGTFQKGDIVEICATGNWGVSTANNKGGGNGDVIAQLATGSTSNFVVASGTIPESFVASNTLYFARQDGTTCGICAIKITRPSTKTVTSKVLTGIKINGTSWDISGLSENAATIATGYAGPPTAQFIYTINYDDSSSDPNKTEDIEAEKSGANYVATSTVLTTNVSLTFTNVSNVLFSMTNPTAPTEALASKTSSDLTATFSPGGSAIVYNGHSSSTAQMVYNDKVNINGSGNSYFKASFPAKLAEGDIIECSNTEGTFFLWHSDSKTNSTTFPYTIPKNSELIGKKVLYVKKNSGYDFASFTVTRPKTIDSQTLGGVKEGDATLTVTTDYIVSSTTVTLTDAHEVALAPTNIKLINHIAYDDASTDDQDVDVTFDGTVTEGYYIGTAIIGTSGYTVRVKKSATAAAELSATSGTISIANSYTVIGTTTVTLTGANLTNGTYDVTADVDGTTISPTSFTVADGSVSQEFTITSTASSAATTVFTFGTSAIGTTAPTFTLTYSKVAQRGLLQTDVSASTTWDWTKAGSNTVELTDNTSPTKSDEFVMANLPEVNNDANFNAQALKVVCQFPTRGTSYYFQGNSIKFTTTVPGTVEVTFSNTGSRTDDAAGNRYLYINGNNTGVSSYNTTMKSASANVPAGEVVIDAFTGEDVATMVRINKIVFTELVPAEVTTYGWATFCSDKALDFTGITDVKAYIVTGHNEKAIEKTQMTGTVPANTPLLLEGVTTSIPVAASSDTNVSANKLVAGDGTAVDAGSNVTRYVLGVNGDDKAEFQKIVSTPATVPAGKAYLEFNETIDAPFLSFDFSDMETTGINAVSKAQVENGEVYNLNGQRVSKPAKGLYIVNGKKVVIK